jgi:excisionase family DNA binding protein
MALGQGQEVSTQPPRVDGDLLGNFRATFVVDPAELHQLDDADLRRHLVLARTVLGRLQGEVDGMAAELARRDRENRSKDRFSAALTAEEVAARLKVTRGWVWKQARKGALPFARRIGRKLVFDEAGLGRWLSRRRVG